MVKSTAAVAKAFILASVITFACSCTKAPAMSALGAADGYKVTGKHESNGALTIAISGEDGKVCEGSQNFPFPASYDIPICDGNFKSKVSFLAEFIPRNASSAAVDVDGKSTLMTIVKMPSDWPMDLAVIVRQDSVSFGKRVVVDSAGKRLACDKPSTPPAFCWA